MIDTTILKTDLLILNCNWFVDNIKNGLKCLYKEKRANIKVYNPNLLCLFQSEAEYKSIFSNSGVIISHPEDVADYYEDLGYTELGIKDVIEVLNNNKNVEWFNSKKDDSKWWKSIFNLLNKESFNEQDQLHNYPIFLHHKDRTRRKLENTFNYYKKNREEGLAMWRDKIRLLEFESTDEEEFLKNSLKTEDFQIDSLIRRILEIHLQEVQNCLINTGD